MKITWLGCFKAAASAFILFLCIRYWTVLENFFVMLPSVCLPIIIGFVIAYVLNILMSFYERHYFKKFSHRMVVKKSRTAVCIILAIITLLAVISLIILLIIPELMSCVKFLIAEIPPILEKIIDTVLENRAVVELLPEGTFKALSDINWKEYVTKIIEMVTSGLGSAATFLFSAISSVFSAIVTSLISVIFAIYLLIGRNTLKEQGKHFMHTYIPEKWVERILHCLSIFNDSFHKFIVGQCTEAVILGLLCVAGMMIFRFPYAAMIGTLVGFTALIPVAGAYIGAGIGAVMMLTESPIKALLFLLFIIVLQQLEGNIIYPKVVGDSIGLPAIWVLASITIAGGLFGIVGMLIGVPITAAVYRLVNEDIGKRDELKKNRNNERN